MCDRGHRIRSGNHRRVIPGRPDRPVDVVLGVERRLGYDLARGRVVDRLGLPAVAVHPLPPIKLRTVLCVFCIAWFLVLSRG